MENPYDTPKSELQASDSSIRSQASARPAWLGWSYLLLIPASLLYTYAIREIAGPGYTGAPNQGAMVVFFFGSLAWPIVALAFVVIIWRVVKPRGVTASILALLSWMASCAVPFLIGMK